jgi:hypothetical protein
MKKLLLVASLVVATAAALAQGTVNFSTKNADVTALVIDKDGFKVGTAFKAQLYAGLTADSLAAVGTPVAFKTGLLLGYVNAGELALPWAGGTTVFIQMRAWNDPYTSYEAAKAGPLGQYGDSKTPISLKLATPPLETAPNLIGLQGFQLIPEPSTIALALLGAAALLLRRRS